PSPCEACQWWTKEALRSLAATIGSPTSCSSTAIDHPIARLATGPDPTTGQLAAGSPSLFEHWRKRSAGRLLASIAILLPLFDCGIESEISHSDCRSVLI